jgi:hypothetical protein
VDPEELGEVRVHQVEVQAAFLDVLPDGLGFSRNDLRAFPAMRVGATHGIDALMTKWQRTPPHRAS